VRHLQFQDLIILLVETDSINLFDLLPILQGDDQIDPLFDPNAADAENRSNIDDANAAQRTPVNAQSRSARVSIPTAPDGSVTASINPPAGEVTVTPSPERIAEVEKTLRSCKTLLNLQVEWGGLTKEEQKATTTVKDEVKTALLPDQKRASNEKTPN
jgi:hypothetical protein